MALKLNAGLWKAGCASMHSSLDLKHQQTSPLLSSKGQGGLHGSLDYVIHLQAYLFGSWHQKEHPLGYLSWWARGICLAQKYASEVTNYAEGHDMAGFSSFLSFICSLSAKH